MSDIIDRAEAVLAGRHVGNRVFSVVRIYGSVITELIAELKTARAQRDEFHAQLDHALAENDRLQADAEMWRGVQRMYEGMGR